MKYLNLIFVAMCLIWLWSCGSSNNLVQTPAAAPAAVWIHILPSVSTCRDLQNLTTDSYNMSLEGYGAGESITITGGSVIQEVDSSAVSHDIPDEDLQFGTYCTLHIEDSRLMSVEMSPYPGCSPGWGEGC